MIAPSPAGRGGRYVLAVATIVIAALIIVTAMVDRGVNSTNVSCSSASVTVIPMGADGSPFRFTTQRVTLNTVAYAEQIVMDRVLVPDVSALGCGFRIIGAEINQRPTDTTTPNGVKYVSWRLSFYATDQAFVNGTTLNTDLFPHAIIISETSEPSSLDSYKSAAAFFAPDATSSCVISYGANVWRGDKVSASVISSSCTSGPNTSWKLVQIRNTYLDVATSRPVAMFEINGINRWIEILPATSSMMDPKSSPILNYDQLLAIANSIVP